jgi:hypothetical protein
MLAGCGAIPALVQLLGVGSSPVVHLLAAKALGCLALVYDHASTIVGAGAIPALVQVLDAGLDGGVATVGAASVLTILAHYVDNAGMRAAITASSASPLVQLLGSTKAGVAVASAAALSTLAEHHDTAVTVAAAGAIPALIHLLGSGSSDALQESAAAALTNLSTYADVAATMAAAAAIPAFVGMLLQPNPTVEVRVCAASALANLTRGDNCASAAGAIPRLVQMLGQDSTALMQERAAAALGNLSRSGDNVRAVVAAGAIPALTRLARGGAVDHDDDEDVGRVRVNALRALEDIRSGNAKFRAVT